MEMLDRWVIAAMMMAANARDKVVKGIKDFYDSEDGISNVVATIIILLLVVILIGVFWDRLKVFVGGIMDQIFGTHFTDEGL